MADRSDIDEVRTRIDLVSVIERYVTLKRAGGKLKGLCPFHSEKTPSFTVSPEIGRWYCFGSCAEGGDVFKFVQKIENLSFPEALERLALQANVTLTSRNPRGDGTSNDGGGTARSEAGEKDRIYKINALALRFYRDVLGRSPVAREYLQARGLVHAAQENFSLGFAADEWDGLCRFLTQKGIALADAEKAGLVTISERGAYDRLRGRLIFPIFDVQERLVGFGGRLIGEAKPNQPKYWNSPETPAFRKSKEMYGLWRARNAIAKQGRAIIVEGYTDVIACHQAGFENVIATLGTSLTEEHVQTLVRLASIIVLAFDADSAGLRAAGRATQMFEAQKADVRVLNLPSGEDPDSLLGSGKRLIFEKAIETAQPIFEYRIKQIIRQGPAETEQDKIALIGRAVQVLADVPTIVEREPHIMLLAPFHPQYNVSSVYAEEQIRQDVGGYIARQEARQTSYGRSGPQSRPVLLPQPPSGGNATEKAERHLLRAMVSDDLALAGPALALVTPEDFVSEKARTLAEFLLTHWRSGQSLEPKAVLAALGQDDPRADLLADLLMNRGDEPLLPEALTGEITHLKDRAKTSALSLLKQRIADGTADTETLRQFARLQSELRGTPKSPAGREGK